MIAKATVTAGLRCLSLLPVAVATRSPAMAAKLMAMAIASQAAPAWRAFRSDGDVVDEEHRRAGYASSFQSKLRFSALDHDATSASRVFQAMFGCQR